METAAPAGARAAWRSAALRGTGKRRSTVAARSDVACAGPAAGDSIAASVQWSDGGRERLPPCLAAICEFVFHCGGKRHDARIF